jgi:hypothetical protein
LYVSGTLTVAGNTTTVNATTVTTNDLAISVASNAGSAAAANNSGIQSPYASWLFNSTNTAWQSNVGVFPSTNNSVALGGSSNYWSSVYATNHYGTLSTATQNSVTTMTSLASVGTITSGTWNGGIIGATYGGTGVNNGSNTLTLTGASYTLNQSVASGASPTFTGTNFTSIPAGQLSGSTLASGVTASSLTSVGTLTGLTVSGAIVPNANASVNLGSTSAWWNNIYGTATHALYADLAENYQADKTYAPGTVLMFGGDFEVTLADADTPAVAGVVSTNPAHLMNGGLTGQNVAPLALQGRVPCNVIGPVKKGDMMVSAGHGFAKSATNPAIGTVIGKSLYDYPGHGKAVIEVVIGRV